MICQLACKLICIMILIIKSECFVFKAAQVSCSDCTINTQTSYQIVLFRNLAPDTSSTPWGTQTVPAGSNITITFPVEFTLTGSETCAYVLIDSVPSTELTCTVNPSARNITIGGAITSNSFIQSVIVGLNNITNPWPALTTSPFTATIGADYSATDSSGGITIYPGSLAALTITFDPTTVNTTSNMIITATLGNKVPADGYIVVQFPSLLLWTRELSSTHKLPILSTMACSPIQTIKYSISCVGSSNTVIATNVFNSSLNAGTVISFSVNNLFSPPTTEQNLDALIVSTYTSSNYKIDSLEAYVSGLTPKSISLAITSIYTLTINTQVSLTFSFTLTDTISRANYLIIKFPANTTFNYNAYSSAQLNLTSNATYSAATGQLKLYQSSSSSNRNTGLAINLTILWYTTPSSARVTDPIYLKIMSNDGQKMVGSSTLTIVPKAYPGTLSTGNTLINAQTFYTISFNLADAISSSGYMIINVPTQLTVQSNVSVQITASSMASTPTVQVINSSSIRIRNLNTSSSNIGSQNVSMRISNLVQPGSVKNISSFVVQIYFSSSNDLVAAVTTSTIITTTPGSIMVGSVTPFSYITANTNTQYDIIVNLANPLNTGSSIMVSVPASVSVVSGGVCKLQSVVAQCTVSGNTISFNVSSAIGTNATVNASYSSLTNPGSTRPTDSFNVSTFNAASESVDVLSPSVNVSTAMIIPSPLTSPSLVRASKQNDQVTTYTLTFTQPQSITQSTAAVSIVLPADVTVPNSAQLACNSGTTTLTCSISGNTIVAYFTPTHAINTPYNISIAGIKNPSSFKPTPSITITTLTQDLLYKYSTISTGLQVTNTVPSSFNTLSYQFTVQFLNEQTTLKIQLNQTTSPAYVMVQFAASYAVGASSQITCSADNFTPICDLQLNPSTNLYQMRVQSTTQIPAVTTLSFWPLTNPSTIPSDYTWVSTYSSDNYKISQNTNTIKFTTFCTFPCRQCSSTARSACSSCYPLNLTTRVYLFQQQCLSSCPAGYNEDNLDYLCKPCSDPCLECEGAVNYCTLCNTSSPYKYLNKTATTSTCVSECPVYMYPDTTQVPQQCVNCVSPCSQCSTRTTCISCVSSYYFYRSQCLAVCPVNVTVLVDTSCIDCSPVCATCMGSISNCTSCPNNWALYNQTCVSSCPNTNMIIINSACVNCSPECLTCSIAVTNCISCLSNGSYPYFYNHTCLPACPNYYYADSFRVCKSCDALNIGCKNCSSATVCVACDPGYVLLNFNCLSSVPDGYLNISGVAVPCSDDCATCSLTLTNCTSCRTLNLYGNTCKSTCPIGTVPLDRQCKQCSYPCSQCVNLTTICTKCASNSSLYLNNQTCIAAQNCPTLTYPDNSTYACTPCSPPCLECNSSVSCITCIVGYNYVNSTASCQTTCPVKSVPINRVCQACVSPCVQCEKLTTRCLSCIADYYYNPHIYSCTSTCPDGQIANDTIMQCVSCSSPCKTCMNTTDTCLTCINGTFLTNDVCVAKCPDGQYGASGLCKDCENNCTTCSSAVTCLSCTLPLYLYSSKCVEQCPATHSIITSENVCTSCTTVVAGCNNCSDNGECYECMFPRIYFQGYCPTQCPSGYSYLNFTCKKNNETENVLNQTLQSYTFPIPFTILGCVVFVASCMSKLQNSNTYLVGLLYSLFGIIESGALAYLIYCYYSIGSSVYVLNNLLILLAVAAAIYLLNFVAFIAQTPYLLSDYKFSQWIRPSGNKCFFIFITLVSLLINYKAKMILFSRLFRFNCMTSFLQSINKFRIFNLFSFFGLLPQGLALYVCFICIIGFKNQLSIFYAFLDVIIIFLINGLFAILIAWKPDNFFYEETEQGYSINKRMNVNGDDFSKEALAASSEFDEGVSHGPDSYAKINRINMPEIQEVIDQLSASLTDNENQFQQSKGQVYDSRNKNYKVYFANNNDDGNGESSNPFRKQNELAKNSPKKTPNIFTQISGCDQRYSQKQGDHEEFQQSQPGGSEDVNQTLSPRKHRTIVVGTKQDVNIPNSNMATENDDVAKKISQRQLELDQIRKQMQQQQSARKQKRKSRKKLKKSINLDLSDKEKQDKQLSYEEISIKDSSQKQQTQQDSRTKQFQQVNNLQLNAETKQANVEEDFKDVPKQTIGSWMELRITEQNKKLPVFNQQNQMKTLSTPDSHQSNQISHDQNIQHVQQQLTAENVISGIEQDLQLKQQTKIKLNQKQERQIIQQLKQTKSIQQKQQQQTHKNQYPQDQQRQGNQAESKLNQFIKEGMYHQKQQNLNQKNKKSKMFQFAQEDQEYDERAGTRLNLQNSNPKNFDNESLIDSEHDHQKIIQRPYSGTRKNQKTSNQALLEILANAQREKMNSRGGASHRIRKEQKNVHQGKVFKHSGGPTKSEAIEEEDEKNVDSDKKSRVYLAGLKQFKHQQQEQLNRKNTVNYPLSSIRKKSIQDHGTSSSINQNRNKSLGTAIPFRKFTSKDLSSDNLDQLGVDYVNYNKNYEELMNERQQSNTVRKPGTSGTARSSHLKQSSGRGLGNYRRGSFLRDSGGNTSYEEQSLQRYYHKQQKKSKQKREKSKPLLREKSLEQTKRVKELERIYLNKK